MIWHFDMATRSSHRTLFVLKSRILSLAALSFRIVISSLHVLFVVGQSNPIYLIIKYIGTSSSHISQPHSYVSYYTHCVYDMMKYEFGFGAREPTSEESTTICFYLYLDSGGVILVSPFS